LRPTHPELEEIAMDETTTLDTPVEDPSPIVADTTDSTDPVDEELLLEEVSIDGMCGVY